MNFDLVLAVERLLQENEILNNQIKHMAKDMKSYWSSEIDTVTEERLIDFFRFTSEKDFDWIGEKEEKPKIKLEEE